MAGYWAGPRWGARCYNAVHSYLLPVAWTISGVVTSRQKELIGRYRMASADERTFILNTMRVHLAENFPEMEAP